MTESRQTDQGSAAQHESPDSQVALSASAAQRFAESAVTPLSERRRPSAGDLGQNGGLKRTGAGKATPVPGGGGVPSAPQSPAVDQQATTVMPQRPGPLPRRSGVDSEATTVMPQNPTAAPGRSAAFLPETTVMPQRPGPLPRRSGVDSEATTVMPQRPGPLPRRSGADSEATTVMPQNPTAAPGRSAAFLPETTVMPQNPEIRPQRPVGGPQAPMGMGGRPVGGPQAPMGMGGRPVGGPQAPFAGGQAPASSPVGAARSLPLGEPLPQHPEQTRESPVGTQTTTADESTKAPSSVHTDRSIPLGETGPQWPEDTPNTLSAPEIAQESATDATKESGPEAPSNPTPRTPPSSGSNTPVSSPSTRNAAEGQFSPRFQAFVESGPSMPGPKTAQYPTLAPRTAQVWSVPKPKKKPLPIFESVVAGAGAALMLVGVLGFLQASGPIVTVFLAILCIVPLAIVVSVLLFIDRFEPEPLGMKLAALAWGGGVSIFFGIMGNEFVQYSVTEQTGDEVQGMIFSVVVGAPVVEELLKGLGVLVIVWARRTHISSAIDGLVYAGFAACGFLVVEDFTYFVRAVLTDGDLGQMFFQRVVMGVFGHVMYTSCMGWATGWAVTRARSAAAGCGAVALGWFTGMLLHATWNGTAVLSGGDDELFDTFYIFIHVPLFLLWFLFIVLAMKRERRDAAAGLMPYVAQGWIVPSEIQMVCDPRSRRAALAWASNGGPLAKKAMKQFMYALATLGLHQVVMKNRGPEQARIEESRELAKEATSQRKIFMKLTGMRRF
ncbi:PrsW family glutamic-type intramembrane protease [uncultured Actinomyces sp.]|uniref:PrsW family intramembrane metalloprotease n=1 Tax=uncultured Actinomyces sp. TaxID=249061 RepID=UPI0028E6E54A|nr:PrsW family glutamic-type intramembrane protease [uncultured Actinomyces sp.]